MDDKVKGTSASELLRRQMPMVREINNNLKVYGYVEGTDEWEHAFGTELSFYRKFVGEL